MSYSPHTPQPKSVTIVGVILILLGTAGIISYHLFPFHTIVQTHQEQLETSAEPSKEQPVQVQQTSCRVLSVYDGDTIACDLNHNNQIDKPQEEIRLLGIDTPEMHYSKKNHSYHTSHEKDEPFAKEASQLMTDVADKQIVYLTFDENPSDKYGRSLAYASLDPKDEAGLCKLMLSKGFAKTLFIPPNFRHVTDFKAIEHQAKTQHLGLWSAAGTL